MRIIILFIVISGILSFILLGHGNLIGGGEAGVIFYNLSKIMDISFPAWGNQILGGFSGITVSSGPLFLLLAFLQKNLISGQSLQALMFFMLIFITLYSMSFFYKTVFEKASDTGAIFASLFYLFNSYSLANIWNRFLPNTITFYAILPFVLGLYIKSLKTKRLVFAIGASLTTAIFAYGFAGPSQTLIFLGLVTYIFLFEWILGSSFSFLVKHYTVSIFSWFIFNFWWISQQIFYRFSTTFSNVSGEFFSSIGNLDIFIALSESLGQLKNLFLLKHDVFFSLAVDLPFSWPLFYNLVPSLIVEWAVVLVVIYFSIKRLKDKQVTFLFSIFIIGIFFSKGSSEPLGGIFKFFFEKISYLQFFRNPFEKLGIILPLSFAPMFGITCNYLYRRFDKKFLVLAGVYLVGFLGFPFWTRLVFTSGNEPANNPKIGYQVEVPNYYKQADEWFSSQSGLFRFVSLPLGGEGIFYRWPKGYVGVEQSGVLFSTPSVSYDTTIPFYHQIATKLQKLFIIYEDFYKIANLINARYILFRPDFNFKLSGMRDPQSILSILEKRLTPVKEFGPLKIYNLDNEEGSQKIYPATKFVETNKNGDLEDVYAVDFELNTILVSNKDRVDLPMSAEIIHNSAFFEIDIKNYPRLVEAPDVFPHVSKLPTDKVYPLILLKEELQLMSKSDIQEKTMEAITLSGKRLVEVEKLANLGNWQLAKKSLDIYLKETSQVMGYIENMAEFKQPSDQIWKQDDMFETFASHLYILKRLQKSSGQNLDVNNAIEKFKKLVASHKILPYWDFLPLPEEDLENTRAVYQFEVESAKKYFLIIPKTLIFPQSFKIENIKYLQVDDKILEAKTVIGDNYLDLGGLFLDKGIHEISFSSPQVENSVDINEITLDSENIDKASIPINSFDPFLRYEIGFDYLFNYGDTLSLNLVSNTDSFDVKTKKIRHVLSKKIHRDEYSNLKQSFSYVIGENNSADTAYLDMSVDYWNNCLALFQGKHSKRCKNKLIYDSFNRPTKINIFNIHIYPKLPRQAKLVFQADESTPLDIPVIKFEKISSTRYRYWVKSAKNPFVMVFSELFDAGWKLSIDDEFISNGNHLLVNGYANAWVINRTGDFQGEIEFYPQRYLSLGYKISGVAVFLGVLLVLRLSLWK